jgi:hypothetical protein
VLSGKNLRPKTHELPHKLLRSPMRVIGHKSLHNRILKQLQRKSCILEHSTHRGRYRWCRSRMWRQRKENAAVVGMVVQVRSSSGPKGYHETSHLGSLPRRPRARGIEIRTKRGAHRTARIVSNRGCHKHLEGGDVFTSAGS